MAHPQNETTTQSVVRAINLTLLGRASLVRQGGEDVNQIAHQRGDHMLDELGPQADCERCRDTHEG